MTDAPVIEPPRAAVVGAGLAGLTAALRLQQSGWAVDVFESEDHVGGRAHSVHAGGYIVDTGASALGSSYRAYLSLVEELGLSVHPPVPHVAIPRDGRLHHLRLDRLVRSGATTRLLGPLDKLRAARLGADVALARARGQLAVHTGARVREVRDRGTAVEVDGTPCDACVLGCPLPAAADIFGDPRLEHLSRRLPYTQCLKVALGTTRRPASPAFLAQLSSWESPEVALIFLDHNKAPDRAPPGRALLDCCWEAGASRRRFDASDDELIARSLAVVERVLGDVGDVDFAHVTRWAHALPHTRPGAYRAIGAFSAALDSGSRVQFAADYLSAAGQNTAVAFGERAARNLIIDRI